MTSDIVKVGMVGLGLASTPHLKGYLSHPNAQVVAVCDLNEERVKRFAEEHSIPQVFTSFDEMLLADIDAVDITTPTFLHAPMTRQAAEAGKHVHCEKPFCRNVKEGQEACEAAERNGVKIVVGETYVFISSHVKARELIEAGEIGRPLQVRQRHGSWFEREKTAISTGAPDRSWRVDPERSGGGAYPWIYDHAVHFLSAAEFFMLDEPISEVYAVSASDPNTVARRGATHDPYRTAEADIPIITWKYDDPAKQGLWMRAERLNGKYDYMHGFSTTIVGEKGMIEVLGEGGHNLLWNGEQQHLILHRDGKKTQVFRFDEGGDDVWQSDIAYYSQGHIFQTHHFIDSIINNTEPKYSGRDGLHIIACTLAAIRSAQENRPVRVDEIGPEYTAY